MQTTLIEQGVTLMLVGMGTVFVFLTALVTAMSLMAVIARWITPAGPESVSDEEVAAISAAIATHRNRRP